MQAGSVLQQELHVRKVQVLQTNEVLPASGLAANEGSMASLFAQVQQLQTAVTALTSQPHLVRLANCI
jgi:hypothetical protein